jgi:protein-tyrosine phosphatase
MRAMPDHPDRHLRLQGASNFRDLGGYTGEGGRRIRWRRLFRSDHLGGLTAGDHEQLRAFGLAHAFDFRGVDEQAAAPYAIDGVRRHSLSIEPTVSQRMQDIARVRTLTAADAVRLMRELYRMLVNDQAHRFAALFEHLLADEAPLVFHCTAGKDRTGIAAALILLALGVPMATVRQDFLLTNRHFQPPALARSGLPPDVLEVLWKVQEGFLDAALEAIERDHGGVDRYLAQRLALGPAARRALAARWLQP